MKRIVRIVLVNFLCGLFAASSILAQTEQKDDLPGKFLKTPNPLVNRYIVVLDDRQRAVEKSQSQQQVALLASTLTKIYDGTVKHVYSSALKGFSIEISEKEALALSRDAQVKYVVEDGLAFLTATQYNATWGLDRIDQRYLPLSSTYDYAATGSGVRAYVIDTGVLPWHAEFGGRASVGADFIGDGQGGIDCNGHGTHVSGTIAGSVYGVAKETSIIGVRVFGCSGGSEWSTIIAGVDWVRANRVLPAVANMSLGGGANQAVDDAVRNLINSGVTVAVAAGNNYGYDANFVSPARVLEAITVGASNINDGRAAFSNIGTALDLFAPGENITSAWSNGGYNTISGTSMATPHVAGVAALYLQSNPYATPADVSVTLVNSASAGVIYDAGAGSPNRLLYSLLGGAPPPPPPPTGTVPAAPSNLFGERTHTAVFLDWTDNSNNENGFIVEMCRGTSCTNFFQAGQTGPDATFFSATGLAQNTYYRFRVRAVNGVGSSAYSNTILVRTGVPY